MVIFLCKVSGIYLVTVYVATFWWRPTQLVFEFWYYCFNFLFAITFEIYNPIFNGIFDGILIPEFIVKRPFREVEHRKREEILQEILHSVNNKVYGYTNVTNLLSGYNGKINTLERKYLEHYETISAEEIQGWDKSMLVAKNLQDDGLKFAYDNVVSSDLIDKYTKKKPIIAPENNNNQLGKDNNNEYELSNIKDARNVSDII